MTVVGRTGLARFGLTAASADVANGDHPRLVDLTGVRAQAVDSGDMGDVRRAGPRQESAGMIRLGDLRVGRIGFGTMRISAARNAVGARDPEAGRALVRHAVDRGVTFLDTANIYGLGRCEELMAVPST